MSGLTLHFEGSEVTTIEIGAGQVVVRFAVAQARRAGGHAGQAMEDGYVPAVELVCKGATVQAHEGPCVGRLSEGEVIVGGERQRRIPLPYQAPGPAVLTLMFANGARFSVQAAQLSLDTRGTPRFLESLAC